MKQFQKNIILFFLILFVLTGCMYPKSELRENQLSNEDELIKVQQAIERFHEDENGRLPIKTKPNETPVFEKYILVFNELLEKGYLDRIPSNAFEKGGYYQYAFLDRDIENDPKVKLIDLRIAEQIRTLNTKIEVYRSKSTYPPFGEKIVDGVYRIDYKKLNMDHEPTVKSPYSEHLLPLVLDGDGKVYVDYRKDLKDMIQETEKDLDDYQEDVRYLLVDSTPFLPAYSLPYIVNDNNDPVFK